MEMPEHLKGHRFSIHVVGEPEPWEGSSDPSWRFQRCMRGCGGCLNVMTQREPEPLEVGSLFAYIHGPKYRGSVIVTPEVLALGDFCERKETDHEADGASAQEPAPGE